MMIMIGIKYLSGSSLWCLGYVMSDRYIQRHVGEKGGSATAAMAASTADTSHIAVWSCSVADIVVTIIVVGIFVVTVVAVAVAVAVAVDVAVCAGRRRRRFVRDGMRTAYRLHVD